MAKTETATLGGGCFWCLEAVYEQMEGVQSVASGYMGGHRTDPTYAEVCGGRTGHAEVAQLLFEPDVTSFAEILEVFFSIHDPTTLNRQGNDTGTQYRSVIFYHSEQQRATAQQMIRELDAARLWAGPIVTELQPASKFYPAEDYHQKYFRNNPAQSYCVFVVGPKVSKFRQKFAGKVARRT